MHAKTVGVNRINVGNDVGNDGRADPFGELRAIVLHCFHDRDRGTALELINDDSQKNLPLFESIVAIGRHVDSKTAILVIRCDKNFALQKGEKGANGAVLVNCDIENPITTIQTLTRFTNAPWATVIVVAGDRAHSLDASGAPRDLLRLAGATLAGATPQPSEGAGLAGAGLRPAQTLSLRESNPTAIYKLLSRNVDELNDIVKRQKP